MVWTATGVDEAQREGNEPVASHPTVSLLRRWWVSAVLYAVLLLGLMVILPDGGSFGGDDGAYGGQVYALQEGAWSLERPLPVVSQHHEGWLNTAITPDGPLPYTSNPAYVLLLDGVAEITPGPRHGAGDLAFALGILPAIGALAAAVLAWAIARQLAPSATRPGEVDPAPIAFWLVALSPVLVNSTTLWAHTLSTAFAGASLLALLALSKREGLTRSSLVSIGWLVLAVAATAAIRTEAVFWIAGLGFAAVTVLRTRLTIVGIGVASPIGLAVWLGNRLWGSALRADRLPIETSVVELQDSGGSWISTRIPAAWQLLVTSLDGGPAPLLGLAALAMAAYGGYKLRTTANSPIAGLTIVASLLFYCLRIVIASGETISGLLVAWPIVVVLLIAGSTPDRDDETSSPPAVCALLIPGIVVLVAVVATQYSISGGHQWGGRYLSMAVIPIAVAAAIRGRSIISGPMRRPLVALLVVPALVGAVATYRLHVNHERVVVATTEIPAEVVITEIPALPRIAWTELPTAFYVAELATVDELLTELAAAGVETVNIQGLEPANVDGVAGYHLVSTTDNDIRHLVLTP